MRTLGEIMDMVQAGQKPEYDELRLAVEVLRNLSIVAGMGGVSLPPKKNDPAIDWTKGRKEQNIKMFRSACLRSPADYLGWNNNPDNPEYQKRVEASRQLAEKILERMKSEKESEAKSE